MPKPESNPPQAYRNLVFQDLPPDPDALIDAGATLADLERDRLRYRSRQRARAILDVEVPALERQAGEQANGTKAREIMVQARGRRSEATNALVQTACLKLRDRLARLRAERGHLAQKCEARAETLDCEPLIAAQRARCGELALAAPQSWRERKNQPGRYAAALDELRRLTALRDQRDAAVADNERDHARMAELDRLIAQAQDALLDPQAMNWSDCNDSLYRL